MPSRCAIRRVSRNGDNAAMKAPKRRRPLRRRVVAPPIGADLTALAGRVAYVGSSEHKSFPSFAGPFSPRADASKCDPRLGDRDKLTGWLRDAFSKGQTGELWDGDFPRYAWCRRDGVTYEARLTNPTLGEYKGYPLEPDEIVEGLT